VSNTQKKRKPINGAIVSWSCRRKRKKKGRWEKKVILGKKGREIEINHPKDETGLKKAG